MTLATAASAACDAVVPKQFAILETGEPWTVTFSLWFFFCVYIEPGTFTGKTAIRELAHGCRFACECMRRKSRQPKAEGRGLGRRRKVRKVASAQGRRPWAVRRRKVGKVASAQGRRPWAGPAEESQESRVSPRPKAMGGPAEESRESRVSPRPKAMGGPAEESRESRVSPRPKAVGGPAEERR